MFGCLAAASVLSRLASLEELQPVQAAVDQAVASAGHARTGFLVRLFSTPQPHSGLGGADRNGCASRVGSGLPARAQQVLAHERKLREAWRACLWKAWLSGAMDRGMPGPWGAGGRRFQEN